MESPDDLEEKFQLLVEASATLLGAVHLDDPRPSILATVARVTEADACAIWHADVRRGVWEIVASCGLSDSFASTPLQVPEGPPPTPERERQYAAEGIRGLMTLPLDLPGRQGMLVPYYRTHRDFRPSDSKLAGAIANAASAALRSWELLRDREQSRVMMELTVRALREQEDRLNLAMEAGNLGFWEWDPGTSRVFCSDQMIAILGLEPGKFDGSYATFLDRVHNMDRSRFEEAMARACCRAGRFEQEFRVVDSEGNERWIEGSGKAIFDDRLEVIRVVGVGIDVTERRLLELRLRDAQKRESVGLLAAGVAHDFNNLLTGIMGNASLAGELVAGSEAARAMLDKVVDASRRAAALTHQLLAYSGQGKFVVLPMSLSTLVREIGDLIEASISKRITLSLDITEELPLVEADSAQMQQVILNLVVNASEAIGDEAGEIGIRIGAIADDAAQENPRVFLEVRDTGCGMDAATQERIFDPFFTTKFTGRGLGLAAVSGIVRGHRGVIEVSSELGKGSTFRVVLPALSTQQSCGNVAGNSAA